MRAAPARPFEPRKTPVQERSTITVDAISEATIQVLLTVGLDQLTTTKVAERAGVSIGTLYQYYPNKQSLLYGLLDRHMTKVAEAVEEACKAARGKPIQEMLSNVVETYIEAKMRRIDVSTALYQISADIGGPAIVKRSVARSRKALLTMLQTAPNVAVPPKTFAVDLMFAAMGGATASFLEAKSSVAMIPKLRLHLVLLCQTFMSAVTTQDGELF